jgi:putative serine protease PepD
MGIAVDTRYTGNGALISTAANGVISGGPADKAGIKAGDLIIAIDGVEIASSDELIVAIRSHNVGDKVKIKFTRNTVTREVSVILAASKK